jgi:Zn-finger nucleic acid-binding protein
MSERQGIEIDYCPSCRGVWLDRGELDKIIERVVSGEKPTHQAPPPPPTGFGHVPPPPPPPPSSFGHMDYKHHHDYDHHKHHYGHHKHHKHHKKDHWFDDLFD